MLSGSQSPRSRLHQHTRTAVRILGRLAAALAAVLAIAVVLLYAATTPRIDRRYGTEVHAIAVPTSADAVARGRHLARIYLCQECHGENLGGRVFADIPLTVYLPAPNLTRGAGGVASRYDADDWARAVLDGVRPDGRSVVFMPSHELRHMSDEDLGAIVAFINQAPPVAHGWPPARIRILGRVVMAATHQTVLPAEHIDRQSRRIAPPPAGPTAAYGDHLITTAGCRSCHRQNLSGGAGPPPGGADLTPEGAVDGWTEADFVRAMRTAVRPDGSRLAPSMPRDYRDMTDVELTAIWQYLTSLPQSRSRPARERRGRRQREHPRQSPGRSSVSAISRHRAPADAKAQPRQEVPRADR